MAIDPGYKTFTFDGESSGDYGVYITGEAVYNAPEREVEMIQIPGRNGAFALDKGRFENIEVTYPAGTFDENQGSFAEKVSDFRNMLASRRGYCRLEDEYHPDEFRKAIYKSGLEVKPVPFQRAGEFEITFDCMPQRWLKSGEAAVAITSGGSIINPTLFDSSPMLEVKGYGSIEFNGYEIELENALLGPVVIFDGGTKPPLTTSIDISSSLYNPGDTITIPAGGNNEVILEIESTLAYPGYLWGNINSIVGGQVGRDYDNVNHKLVLEVTISMTEMVITAGTDSSQTDTLTCQVEYMQENDQDTIYTTDLTVTVTRTYDAALNTLTWTFSSSDTGSKLSAWTLEACWVGNIIADSTISIIGNPTYIDCDLGEAYKYQGTEIVSLNGHIDLGSELPTFAPGTNTVIYDNTITELKIIPRWWKI